jgi:hypothetical protein
MSLRTSGLVGPGKRLPCTNVSDVDCRWQFLAPTRAALLPSLASREPSHLLPFRPSLPRLRSTKLRDRSTTLAVSPRQNCSRWSAITAIEKCDCGGHSGIRWTRLKKGPQPALFMGGPTDRRRYRCRSSLWADRVLPLVFSSKIPHEYWAGDIAAGCWRANAFKCTGEYGVRVRLRPHGKGQAATTQPFLTPRTKSTPKCHDVEYDKTGVGLQIRWRRQQLGYEQLSPRGGHAL